MKWKSRKEIAIEKIKNIQIRISELVEDFEEGNRDLEDFEHEIGKKTWGLEQQIIELKEFERHQAAALA